MLKPYEYCGLPTQACKDCTHYKPYYALSERSFCSITGVCEFGITEVTDVACPQFEPKIKHRLSTHLTADGLLRDIAERLTTVDTLLQDDVTRNIEYTKLERMQNRLHKKFRAGELDNLYKDDPL